jgi:hypothetical protein
MFVDNLKPNGGTGKMLIKSGHNLGKTWLAAFIALWFVCCFPFSSVLMMSSSGTQVKERLFAEFRRLYRSAPKKLGGELLSMSLKIDDKWGALAVSPSNPDNFQGEHAEHILIIFDEAQAVPAEFWDAKEGMLGSANGCFLGISNPLYTDGKAAECWRRPHEYAEDRRKEWGEDSPLFQSRVRGNYPKTSSRSLLSVDDADRSARLKLDIRDGMWLGVDIATEGADSSWGCVMRNRTVIHMRMWQGFDTMESVGCIHELVRDYDIPWEHVNIDSIGVGKGVYDRLIEQNHPVNGVVGSQSPWGDWSDIMPDLEFLNRRAELHWALRTLVHQDALCIPAKFSNAVADLISIRYKVTSKGQIQIEDKDSFRRRVGRSPDAGDALVYACARGTSTPTVAFTRRYRR